MASVTIYWALVLVTFTNTGRNTLHISDVQYKTSAECGRAADEYATRHSFREGSEVQCVQSHAHNFFGEVR